MPGRPNPAASSEQATDDVARIVALNTTALVRLANAIAPRLAQAGEGAIVRYQLSGWIGAGIRHVGLRCNEGLRIVPLPGLAWSFRPRAFMCRRYSLRVLARRSGSVQA